MTELDEHAAVRRLIDRFGFGAKPGALAKAQDAGFAATLDRVLAPGTDAGAKATPVPELGPEPEKPSKKQPDPAAKKQAKQELKKQSTTLTAWWLDRMVATDAPLVERLTWFWHGHFATSNQKVRSARLMLAQNETFRRLGRGDFGALAHAMIVDPALLVWLDGQKNKVGAANENLGREFMELFTLGIGNYSETDVREASRALTGWMIDRDAAKARLVPQRHDTKDKTLLGHTGNLDASSFVDILVAHPASPRFIAGRLWARLVSATPPAPDVLTRLVGAYGPKHDVTALLRAIAAEPAFKDSATTLVKQPVEWLVGLMRALELRPSQLPDKTKAKVLTGLRGMGQIPFLPPSVGGWPAAAAWLTTAAGLARVQTARLLTTEAKVPDGITADAAAQLLGVDRWSDRTKAALAKVSGKDIVAVAAAAPEYVVSG
jgi:uncharacterized protein (DUF1800 family)